MLYFMQPTRSTCLSCASVVRACSQKWKKGRNKRIHFTVECNIIFTMMTSNVISIKEWVPALLAGTHSSLLYSQCWTKRLQTLGTLWKWQTLLQIKPSILTWNCQNIFHLPIAGILARLKIAKIMFVAPLRLHWAKSVKMYAQWKTLFYLRTQSGTEPIQTPSLQCIFLSPSSW